MYYKNRDRNKQFARSLRLLQTDAEKLLWGKLRNRQLERYKFYRQFCVDKFILDFYCVKKKLAIELDGSQHLQRKYYDAERTNRLSFYGISVIRFWDNDLMRNMDGVIEIILFNLKGRG